MNTRKLQINDYVIVNNNIVRVITVTNHKIGYRKINQPNDSNLSYARSKDISPIEINEAFLLELGFTKDEEPIRHDIYKYKVALKEDIVAYINLYKHPLYSDLWVCDIKNYEFETIVKSTILYVHQIQNTLNLTEIDYKL